MQLFYPKPPNCVKVDSRQITGSANVYRKFRAKVVARNFLGGAELGRGRAAQRRL